MTALLTIDLVPEPLHGKSLAQTQRWTWQKLTRTYKEYVANKQDNSEPCCEICGDRGKKWAVDIHELWEYIKIDKTGIQKLCGLMALCPQCHAFKHYGRSQLVLTSSQLTELKRHVRGINNWTVQELRLHITQAGDLYRQRSKLEWTQDFSAFLPAECQDCGKTRGAYPWNLGKYSTSWTCTKCAVINDVQHFPYYYIHDARPLSD